MKLSIAVSTPDAEFSALALKGSFEDNFSLVKDAGYDGVELNVKNPAMVDRDEIVSLLDRYGLVCPAVGTGRAFGEEGLCFSSPDESNRKAAVQRIRSQVDFAGSLGAKVIIGLILGKNPVTAESEQWAVDCLAECGAYADEKGVDMVLEPINRYETSFIINVDTCLRFLDSVGHESCKVLLDTFHMNIEEPSIIDSIKKAGKRIGHVHVADSNRWYPGAGHTDFKSIVAALRDAGYDGFLSAEILPQPDPETAARETVKYLRPVIED
ncbi:MAG TPA: 5-keto-L-gluconate epimerase [bacterium]|nr:5-keto-L-gluconate epimerase [bacterium]